MSEEQEELRNAVAMDKKLAAKMIRAYAEASQDPLPYTRSVWFPIKKVTTLFQTMNDQNANGVRIYFGIYTREVIEELNNEAGAMQIPSTYEGRVTIIFVSTKNNGSDTGEDYYTERFLTPPENRGLLCPPKSGCDCESDLVDPKPAACDDPI